jgi:hypothetical protein
MKNVVAALALGIATSVFAADAAKTPPPPDIPAKKEVKKDEKSAVKKEEKKEVKKDDKKEAKK